MNLEELHDWSDDFDDREYPDGDDWGDDDWDDESDSSIVCTECGAEVYEDLAVCPVCGAAITYDTSIWSGRSWWWIAIGLLGIVAVIMALATGF